MHISEFKKGDVITRVEKSKETGLGDSSGMGDRLVFIGIANRQIHLDEENIKCKKLIKYSFDEWSEGWEPYIDPKTLK